MTTDTASLNDTPSLRSSDWRRVSEDPLDDRSMLAIQYAVAIVAALAAGLLSLVH
jgi:hypothetical protein